MYRFSDSSENRACRCVIVSPPSTAVTVRPMAGSRHLEAWAFRRRAWRPPPPRARGSTGVWIQSLDEAPFSGLEVERQGERQHDHAICPTIIVRTCRSISERGSSGLGKARQTEQEPPEAVRHVRRPIVTIDSSYDSVTIATASSTQNETNAPGRQ